MKMLPFHQMSVSCVVGCVMYQTSVLPLRDSMDFCTPIDYPRVDEVNLSDYFWIWTLRLLLTVHKFSESKTFVANVIEET